MDNKGNRYRVNNALVAGFFLIGLALAIVCYFAKFLAAIPSIGVFVAVSGAGVLAMSCSYSSALVKFGPSEADYRLAIGLVMLIVGVVMILYQFGLEWYIYVAVIIIAVALLGMVMAVRNGKRMGDE